MSPPVSGIIRLISRIAVVLPDPDGPTSTHTSPAGTVKREVGDRRLALAGIALADVAQLELGRLRNADGPSLWAVSAVFKGGSPPGCARS